MHAVDLSRAVDAAWDNLRQRNAAFVYQADLQAPPFAEKSFDLIYSIGVLHHTPNTRAAFLSLIPYLKPGGEIAIWVYSKRLRRLVGSRVLRPLTTRFPSRLLLKLSQVAVPMLRVHRLPLIGRLATAIFPTSLDPDPAWRWLDTFDWYSPKYQWMHGSAEVERWFTEAGLQQVVRGSFPVSARGRRPANS